MGELKKALTGFGLTMVVVGSCIGSGIFLTPSEIVGYLPSSAYVLFVWAVGGLITLTGALTYAELSSAFPKAGGLYVFLKGAFGDWAGFLYGWAVLTAVTSGAIAALSLAFASYVDHIIPLGESGIQLLAIGGIVTLTIVNIFGVKLGDLFASTFTVAKLIGILVIVGVGLIWGLSSTNSFSLTPNFLPEDHETGLVASMGLALIGVVFSFGGFHHASFLAAEAKNAKRTVPIAMVVGAAIVTLMYLLTNLAYLYLLPLDTITRSKAPAAEAITGVFASGGILVALLIAVSTLGTVGIYTMSAPRMYFAMARDKLFFPFLSRVHPKFQTPVYAILLQSAWAIVLLLFWGTFKKLVHYTVFIEWIFLSLAAASIYVYRRKNMIPKEGYKAFGYPITPLIFIGITAFIVVNTMVNEPTLSLIGIGSLLLGLPVYFYFRNSQKNR